MYKISPYISTHVYIIPILIRFKKKKSFFFNNKKTQSCQTTFFQVRQELYFVKKMRYVLLYLGISVPLYF